MPTRAQRLAIALVAAVSLSGLTACSETAVDGSDVTQSDAYKIGCPALDAALGTGELGTKAARAGLEKLREQPGLSDQTSQWLDTAIDALKSTDPQDLPAEARKRLVDGCADHDYPLRNLTTS